MFIPDIFIQNMDAIRYSSAGVEFGVLVDEDYTDKAYEEIQIAIDAYDDGHFETRKEAIEAYMNPIRCPYMVFYNNEATTKTELHRRIQRNVWVGFVQEVMQQCPIVKTLEL